VEMEKDSKGIAMMETQYLEMDIPRIAKLKVDGLVSEAQHQKETCAHSLSPLQLSLENILYQSLN